MSINIPTAYKTKIITPYGSLKYLIEWCKNNCQDEWQFDEELESLDTWSPAYNFYFTSARDYVNFLLFQK